ncbi:MAG: hypothetical protein QOH32_1964 [Bradyrhizobium sp.]|nr:hypothetical protein [Bradyrhizobium sp.]
MVQMKRREFITLSLRGRDKLAVINSRRAPRSSDNYTP